MSNGMTELLTRTDLLQWIKHKLKDLMFDKTMLLDGDIFLYIVTTQCEEEINWGDDLFTLHSDFKTCRDKLADTITYYQNILLCKHAQ